MNRLYSKQRIVFLCIILCIVNALTIGVYKITEHTFYKTIAQIIGSEQFSEQEIMRILKSEDKSAEERGKTVLTQYGYKNAFVIFNNKIIFLIILCGIVSIITVILYFTMVSLHNKKTKERIKNITLLTANVQQGNYTFVKENDDEFSALEDELYKTLIALRETKLNALSEKEAYKENLENIAHQLKIPIAAIRITLELLEDNKAPCTSADMQKLKSLTARLETLTDVLLKLARINSGAVIMKREKFLLEECVQHALELVEDELHKKNIALSMQFNQIGITGDFYWLSEAFLNILKNFINLAPAVHRITVTAQENSIYTEVRFENDGHAIPEHELTQLFNRFYKTSADAGFGIGLAMTQSILKNHNAEIRAENKKAGVVFRIKFYK